jgi:hypothetical protein
LRSELRFLPDRRDGSSSRKVVSMFYQWNPEPPIHRASCLSACLLSDVESLCHRVESHCHGIIDSTPINPCFLSIPCLAANLLYETVRVPEAAVPILGQADGTVAVGGFLRIGNRRTNKEKGDDYSDGAKSI